VGSGLLSPGAVAVDGSGNIYIADTSNCQGSTTKYPQNSSHHIIRHLSNYMVN